MDKKIKQYIGYILALSLVIVGLNALFGGSQVVLGGYDVLPILAIVTPIYTLVFMRKKTQ